MGFDNDLYDTINALLDEFNDQPQQQLQLAMSVQSSLGSNSPLNIHDYDENDKQFGDYDDNALHLSSIDFELLVVNIDYDMIIDIQINCFYFIFSFLILLTR
jgi:hypothetical protein